MFKILRSGYKKYPRKIHTSQIVQGFKKIESMIKLTKANNRNKANWAQVTCIENSMKFQLNSFVRYYDMMATLMMLVAGFN